MRKIAVSLLMAASLLACKKEGDNGKGQPYVCSSCITAPEANASYDHNSGGVYKGVIVGSSGTLAIYLHNTGTEVKALVVFNGQHATFTTNALDNWSPGDAVNNAPFTGTVDGQQITVYFSVGPNGENPVVQVPDESVTIAVYKETSSTLIRNFEGTYSGDDEGTFNLVFHENDYTIVVEGGGVITGTLVDGKILLTIEDVSISGSFNGTDEIKGTWKNTADNEQGTWAGKRTL